MERVFVGRQPIVDRRQQVVAYELLFRASARADRAVFGDPTLAGIRVMANTFASIGVGAVLGSCRAFVNANDALLRSDLIEALPPDRAVIEVLESVVASEPLLARCRELREHGFTIALDDYVPKDARAELLEVADVVKVDLPGLAEPELRSLVRELKRHDVVTLAEKVETRECFELCRRLGFDLFQGYFFARPVVIESVPLDPARSALMTLLQELDGDGDARAAVETLKRHAALGLNLLRLVNSVAFSKSTQIGSIEDAVNYLGRRQLQRWVLVLLFAGETGSGMRGALLQTAAHRGRLMECIALHTADVSDGEPERAFLVGMLSLVDVLLSRPLGAVVSELGLEPAARDALLSREGRIGRLLSLVEWIERGDWTAIEPSVAEFGLDSEALRRTDDDAYAWVHDLVAAPSS